MDTVLPRRGGGGPAFLEAITYRFRGHSMSDPEFYREKGEIDRWRHLDPIEQLRVRMDASKQIDSDGFDRLQQEAEEMANNAVQFAEESPAPDVSTLEDFVYLEADDA